MVSIVEEVAYLSELSSPLKMFYNITDFLYGGNNLTTVRLSDLQAIDLGHNSLSPTSLCIGHRCSAHCDHLGPVP